MADKIYAGTVGLLIKIDMGETITEATGYSLKVKKPSGAVATWALTIGSATEFYHVTASGELADVGPYIIQPQFTLGGWSGLGTPVKLRASREFL